MQGWWQIKNCGQFKKGVSINDLLSWGRENTGDYFLSAGLHIDRGFYCQAPIWAPYFGQRFVNFESNLLGGLYIMESLNMAARDLFSPSTSFDCLSPHKVHRRRRWKRNFLAYWFSNRTWRRPSTVRTRKVRAHSRIFRLEVEVLWPEDLVNGPTGTIVIKFFGTGKRHRAWHTGRWNWGNEPWGRSFISAKGQMGFLLGCVEISLSLDTISPALDATFLRSTHSWFSWSYVKNCLQTRFQWKIQTLVLL